MAIKEYKLGDISFVKNGTKNKEDQSINGKYNFYVRSKNILKSNDWTINGNYTIIPGEGIFYPLYNEGKASVHQRVYYIKANNYFIKDKYLYYWWLKNNSILYKNSVGTTVKSLRINNFTSPIIRLPNLEDQQQIINIIEPFERLKEKFNIKIKYLKDILHNHDKKSKEIDILNNWAKITTGKRNANYAIQNGNYRFFSCSINKIQFCNSFSFDCESLLLAGNGDIGNVIYFNGKFDAYQRTYVIQCKNFIGNIYFSLVKNKKFFESNSKGSVIKFLTLSTISNIKISLNKEINNIRLAILKYIFICEKIVFNTNLIIDLIIKKMIN